MQGLTSADENEKTQLMKTLLTTDAGKRLMHEGFDSNDPKVTVLYEAIPVWSSIT